MTQNAPRRAAIIGGNRIPFGRAGGHYAKASNQDMLTVALDGLVARFGLRDERLGEVAAGAVLKHSRDRDLTRESVLGSRLSPATPAYDVQQACGTGLETVVLGVDARDTVHAVYGSKVTDDVSGALRRLPSLWGMRTATISRLSNGGIWWIKKPLSYCRRLRLY